MKRLCFACDLNNDSELIAEYRDWHKPGAVWPEVIQSIKDAGVRDMEIYLNGTRLILIMEADDNFELQRKIKMDLENPKVMEWEQLMWQFQEAVPGAPRDQKCTPMELVFKLP